MTPDRIKQIEEGLERATPLLGNQEDIASDLEGDGWGETAIDLLSHAPSDLRYLLSRVRAAEKVAEAAKGTVSMRLSAMKHGFGAGFPKGPEQDLADALTAYDAAVAQP